MRGRSKVRQHCSLVRLSVDVSAYARDIGCRLGECKGYRDITDLRYSDVVQHIQESWSILATPDCVPVHVSLQLMDHSSLGRGNDYLDFKETSKELQKALNAIVNGMSSLSSCTSTY